MAQWTVARISKGADIKFPLMAGISLKNPDGVGSPSAVPSSSDSRTKFIRRDEPIEQV